MDGQDLSRRLAQLLNEDESAGWLDPRTTYDFLYEAAIATVDRTGCLTNTQTITSVADTQEYDLAPDFMRISLMDHSNIQIIKYEDDFLTWKDYDDIIYSNQTESVDRPSHFSIIDSDLPDQVSGTATASGASTGGLSQLSGAGFDYVEAGGIVHNITDGSSGVVISKTSASIIKTALFGGTNNDWTSGDSYVIQPQSRLKIVLDAPTANAGDTITVYYVQRPAPVYHSYGAYRILPHYQTALIKYALWLYKYRDRSPDTGNALYQYWNNETAKIGNSVNRSRRPNNVKVVFRKPYGRR